jgi:hypothetical protein
VFTEQFRINGRPFWLHYSSFLGGNTQTHRQQDGLVNLLLFLQNKESSIKNCCYRKRIGWDDIDWIHLAHDRDQWWTLLNMAMNFPVPKKVIFGKSGVAERLVVSQEGLSSWELVV